MLVIQVAFLLPAPIWITVIRPGNFKALRNAGDWLYNIDKAV
jgi:hypothetical protein